MRHEVRNIAHEAKTIAIRGSLAVLLAAGLAAFQHRHAVAAEEKPSWFQRVLQAARLANSTWLAFRK